MIMNYDKPPETDSGQGTMPPHDRIYEKVPSGIEILDQIWGGLYKGRTYLVIGPQGSGKTVLGFQFLAAGLKKGEGSAFATDRRVEDLLLQIESFGFNIKEHLDEGRLHFLRFPSSLSPSKTNQAINDVLFYLESERVERLVLDSPLSLVLPDLEKFRALIEEVLYRLEELRVSTLMTIREPANLGATKVVEMLEELATGVIRFSYNLKESTLLKRISFRAKWGYPTTTFSYDYKIVPPQGVVIRENGGGENSGISKESLRFIPFNNFLNLIAEHIASPTKGGHPFSIVGVKFSQLSPRIIESIGLWLSEKHPATLHQNSALIFLPDTEKRELGFFSQELETRIKTILPSCEFGVSVVTFPEDGEELEDLLSKIT